MTTQQDSAPAGALSRRRIIQGAAWATPAILIATAAPAAAASGGTGESTVPGAVALTSPAAAFNASSFYVAGTVVYAGATTPVPDAPVTAVTLDVAIQAARLGAGDPVIASGLGWQYAGAVSTNGGATRVFTFSWIGADLSASAQATTELTVRIPKDSSLTGTDVTLTARGQSRGLSVPPSAQTVSITTAAANQIAFTHGNAIRYEEWFTSNPKASAWIFNAGLWWSGPYNPEGASITNVSAEYRVAAADSDGTVLPTGSGLGAGWTAVGAPDLVDGYWRFRYAYAGTLNKATSKTSELQFAVKVRKHPYTMPVQYTFVGESGGVHIVTTGQVPA